MAKKINKDSVRARGFFRLQVREQDGRVSGDTGWKENQITNVGFQDYLCQTLAGMAASNTVAYACLGTGTTPATNETALNGEIVDASNARCAVTPTTIASHTVQFAFTLASSVYTTSHAISNVGLVNSSATNAGSLFAGNTYSSSALATNQSVNASYQIRFS